jgi:predicted DNA-binding antitoxin AbrB/MazE fold protein
MMMSQEFHAIYEHGVLRPLTPLNLPESAVVTGFVQQKDEKTAIDSNDPLKGFLSDEPELIDAIVEEAMLARESHPLRTNG